MNSCACGGACNFVIVHAAACLCVCVFLAVRV
jgi:hypothetical protein